MSKTVNTHEAKTKLSKLLARVKMGEEIIIAKAGKPVARLVPIGPPRAQRAPGSAKHRVWMSPDFEAPLPEEILSEFEK